MSRNNCEYFIVPQHEYPNINLQGRNTKLNNYWIFTKKPLELIKFLANRIDRKDIYITDTYFSRSLIKHYKGQKIIILTKLPKHGYNFLQKLDSCLDQNGRILPSCRFSLYFSNDVILIILSNKDIEYIKSSYLRYNKDKEEEANNLINSLKSKITFSNWN